MAVFTPEEINTLSPSGNDISKVMHAVSVLASDNATPEDITEGWGKTAEIVEQLGIRKGVSLYVEGSLTTRKYQDQQTGIDKYVTEILLDTFQVLTPRNQQNGQQGNGYTQLGNAYGSQQQGYSEPSYNEEDDLPF